ncbi:hypothetical protein BGZ47_008389 [Haplosporangium gracile]|nr:hypothetical protein BGZ47_008389 [Haplosporangium gracile]
MKFNNIVYLPCTFLLVLLFTSGLISAAPVPLRPAGPIIAAQAIHIIIPNNAHLPIVTPVLYKRQVRDSRRLPHDYMKRDLFSTTTLEEEVSESKSENTAATIITTANARKTLHPSHDHLIDPNEVVIFNSYPKYNLLPASREKEEEPEQEGAYFLRRGLRFLSIMWEPHDEW